MRITGDVKKFLSTKRDSGRQNPDPCGLEFICVTALPVLFADWLVNETDFPDPVVWHRLVPINTGRL